MVAGPLVTGQETAGMAVLALGRRKIAVIRTYAGKRTIPELPAMRLELSVFVLEPGMAGSAVFLIMATVAALGAALGFQRMEFQEIVPVTPGHIVAQIIARRKLGINAAAGVAIQAEGLNVTFNTVTLAPRRRQTMRLQPLCIVIGGNSV